ncbi:MAG: hypothetical protein ACK4EX_02415 [Thermaurantimonas sp.]|uniref:hypothetical protein n=1 Tax=Thermaurantimonas sp. TaxID=2681568 RepID=UPI0039198416
MIASIYKAVSEYAGTQMPWLAYIDLQKGQIRRPAQTYPIPLPALLVEFRSISYGHLVQGKQLVSMQIRLSLYLQLLTDTHQGALMQEESLMMLSRIEEVKQHFDGLLINGSCRLLNQADLQPEFGTDYMAYHSDYSSSFYIKSAVLRRAKINQTLIDLKEWISD